LSIPLSDLALGQRDLCFIDTETTGSQFTYHELIELAVIRTSPDGKCVRGEWSAKIVPAYPERITPDAQKLNGYTPEGWDQANVPSSDLWQSFRSFVAGGVPVCHNPSFDRAFITIAAAQQKVVDLALDYHWIGTESFGWPLYKAGLIPKLSLSELCRFFGIPPEPPLHTALNGASTCREVYLRLLDFWMARMASPDLDPCARGPSNPKEFDTEKEAT
jgi:DNA polymerase III epsilon subunit-like protein